MKPQSLTSKILLIGWDAADWKLIKPLMQEGHMPTLQKLMKNGSFGRLATLDPPLSPILWTSIATGKLPHKHGIHGFTEAKPDGSGIRPITHLNRKTKAFWNILSQEGYKTHVVGWWPSHPAEKINGTMISNFYQNAPSLDITKPWPMMKATVHPEEKADFFAKLRIHPGELTEQHILPFVPRAAEIDQNRDTRLGNVAKVTAECSTIHAAATYIMEHEEWDVMAVYYDAIDHYSHGFMKYHPPRREHISEEEYQMYNEVVKGGYRYHDMMLERLVQLAGEDATIILISDHGFHPNHLRPKHIPREPAGPAIEHSPYGIICMNGPGIKRSESIIGAGLLDITPTLLSLLGLPVGGDMDGKILANVLKNQEFPAPVNSWDEIEGDSGMHKPGTQLDADIEMQAMEQLVALGYVENFGDQAEISVKKTENENSFYLARSYLHTGQFDEAVQILEKLHSEHTEEFRYGLHLIQAYVHLARSEDARMVFDEIREILDDNIDKVSIYLTEGRILLSENKMHKALRCFRIAQKEDVNRPGLNLQLGRVFLQLRKWEEANKAFGKELEIDTENADGWHGLGIGLLQSGQAQEAAEHLLKAIELMYHNPVYHYHLGEALYQLEQYEISAEAFSNTLKINPQMNAARQWLAQIYEEKLKQPEKAKNMLDQIRMTVKGTITIVSGLPRSGTSMMMQMLKAGGMEVFTDESRKADESNPQGYLEHEAVKRIARDKRWLPQAEGKVVKVIAQLLKHLPPNFHYKIIFMERDLAEVVNSQQKMLARLKQISTNTMPYNLRSNFEKVVREAKQNEETKPNMEFCFVSHKEVIKNPFAEAFRINEFLGGQLTVEKMAQAVKPELYRENTHIQNEIT